MMNAAFLEPDPEAFLRKRIVVLDKTDLKTFQVFWLNLLPYTWAFSFSDIKPTFSKQQVFSSLKCPHSVL